MTNHDYRTEYLRVEEPPFGTGESVLYRDPLTSLIAYPSFEQYLIAMRFADRPTEGSRA